MHVLILKIDAPDLGKRDIVEHVSDELIAARGHFRVGDPRRDIEVVSVVSATPKRLDNVKKDLGK